MSPVTFDGTSDPDVFLKQHRPSSNVQTEDGWIWVRRKAEGIGYPTAEEEVEFLTKAQVVLDDLLSECERIKLEEPVRSNKKLGKESQKEWRLKAHTKFDREVKEIAIKNHLTSGKWLFYANEETVDSLWSRIVNAYVEDGALTRAGSSTAKVSCALAEGSSGYVVCVYCNDSYDEVLIKRVLTTLIKDIGQLPSAYKTDSNTLLGIDSKHVSQIKSSLYTPATFYSKDEIKEMFEAKSLAKETVRRTAKEEDEEGGMEIGVQESSDEDDEPRVKRQKKE